MRSRKASILLILAVAAFLYFFRLGSSGILYPSNEPRRMLLAKDMVWEGHWLVPHLLGKPYIHKPPMLIWLISSSYTLTGRTDLWASRLPTALCGILGVLFVFLLSKRLLGERTATFAAMMLATSPLWIERARMAEEDIVLALMVVLAFFCFHMAFNEGRRAYWVPFYVFCSFGCLTKLASGLIFPGLGVGSYLLLRRSWGRLKEMRLPWGVLIFCVLTLSWYIYAYHLVGFGRAEGVLLEDTWYKVFPKSEGRPFYHYLLSTIPYFLPWSLLLPAAAALSLERGKDPGDGLTFVLCWLLPNLLFFSFAGAKRDEYILPLYPALAMLTATSWDHFLQGRGGRTFQRLTLGALWLLAIGGIAVGAGLPLAPFLTKGLSRGGANPWPFILSPLFLLCGLSTLWGLRRREFWTFLPSGVGFAVLFFLTYNLYVLPQFLWYKTPHPFCNRVKALLGDQPPLLFQEGGLTLQNEWDGRLEGIGIEELKRRIARGEGLYLLTKPEGLRTLEAEGLPFQVLLRQDPFLKRRWSIALVFVKGYNNCKGVKGGSRSDQEGSRGHPQGP